MKLGQASSQDTTYSLFAIILLIPVLFYENMLAMVDVWIVNETFTHGFLIFPISLWLIWQRRQQLVDLNPVSEPRVLALFFPLLFLWFLSHVVDIQIVQQLCMISIIPVLSWLLLGRKILFSILFPLLFLFFAVPLGQGLIPPMMELTANFVVYLINFFGIPVFRDGLYFTLPTGEWNVVEECSGVRYLIASVALGTIYAYVSYESTRKRLIFILFAIIVPIVANGLRAFGIVMIGHFSGMELATGADHLVYGWVFFGVVIFIMFYIGSFWWDPVPGSNSTQGNAGSNTPSYDRKLFNLLATVSLASIVLLQIFAYQVTHQQKEFPQNLELVLPDHFEGWQYDADRSVNWQPEITSPDTRISKAYRFGNDMVQIDIGYFFYQRPGAEAITSQNRLTNPYNDAWKITSASDFKEQDLYVKEVEVRDANHKVLVWQWYRIGSIQSPDPLIAKVFEAYNRIFTNRSDASYITISTHVEEKDASRARLREFMAVAINEINVQLDALNQK